ncbi:NADH:flavin oxidoreductase [Herbiconiux sp. VKM Ac-1786]|uniref:oxidoreductase n=1 Tax=Herbiconiux sp. VKM Ac-1786 TaxID=2783824 RepID=UPI00188C589B|nr:NADH:flavin oxidoreductase [Herbiconiux sp. VKM Ac-1786]MBF4571865.1 NADH:flavin oxidoreductase [Herbiconiux sp. VKM Ac-1786]
MSTAFPSLFSSVRVGDAEAASRLWLAPMTVAYANLDGTVSTAEVEHYARRARGGASVIMTEHFTISEAGRQLPRQTIVDSRDKLPGLRALADAVHDEGALLIAQIGHAGRYGGPWDRYDDQPRLAPSALEFRLVGDRVVTPTEMTVDDIRETLDHFERAASLLAEAGFDGVMLHASQGFLPSQFLSPRTNQRTDAYGGSFENRIRFVLEAFDRVQRGFGDAGPVGVQLLSDEAVADGWTLHEAVELTIRLESLGAAFFLPTVSTFETLRGISTPGEVRRWGHQLGTAIALQAAVRVPVIANGGLTDPQKMDSLIAGGLVAAVALARPMLGNPDWARDAAAGAHDPAGCPCDPPTCLRTQLTGTICESWPESRKERGYWGREEIDA